MIKKGVSDHQTATKLLTLLLKKRNELKYSLNNLAITVLEEEIKSI